MSRRLTLLFGFTAICGFCGCPAGAPAPTPAPAPTGGAATTTDDGGGNEGETDAGGGPMDSGGETTDVGNETGNSADPGDAAESDHATPAPGFESPEAAFAAAQQAARDSDWRTLANCMTPDGQKFLAGVMMFAAAFGGEESAPLMAVLEKHGVEVPKPELSVTIGEEADTPSEAPEEPEIEDLPGFIADMIAAMEASGMDMGSGTGPDQWGHAELTDVTIDGDSASGTLIVAADAGEQSEPIAFTKTDAGWLLDVAVTSGSGGPMLEEGISDPLAEVVLEDGLTSAIDLTFEQPFQFFGQDIPDGALYVTLNLVGDVIFDTYEYGEFQVVAAEDDTGATLELTAPVTNDFGNDIGEGFIELNAFFLDKKNTLPIQFALSPPEEGAEQLTSLELSVKLKARDAVVVEDVMSRVGGTVDVETVGQLTISKWSGMNDGNPDYGLVINGPADTVQAVTLLDGDGSALDPKEWTGFGGEFRIYTGAELPEDTQMRIAVGGTESIKVVPLKFEDLKLTR